jgi:hypothetical protein
LDQTIPGPCQPGQPAADQSFPCAPLSELPGRRTPSICCHPAAGLQRPAIPLPPHPARSNRRADD